MTIRAYSTLVSGFLIFTATGCAGFNRDTDEDRYVYSFMFRNFDAVRQIDEPDGDGLNVHREYFLTKLRRAGVLRRGLTKEEIESWLGKPLSTTDDQGMPRFPDQHKTWRDKNAWAYGMGYSGLHIIFSDGVVTRYHWWFEDGGPPDETW